MEARLPLVVAMLGEGECLPGPDLGIVLTLSGPLRVQYGVSCSGSMSALGALQSREPHWHLPAPHANHNVINFEFFPQLHTLSLNN